MGWTIAILFLTAIVLLILSFYKMGVASTRLEQQIDHLTFSFKDELHELQQQVKSLQLDAEIATYENGTGDEALDHREQLREMLDMYRRGYSMEGIASEKELSLNDVEQSLAPFVKPKVERG